MAPECRLGPHSIEIDGGGTVRIDWCYPDIYTPTDTLVIGLTHVRAAKSILIRYESERDGWVILMVKTREDPSGGGADDLGEEVEVAFVHGWAAHEKTP